MLNSELNEYWKTVVDTIQEGVMIVNVDGTIISVNAAFEAITGYPQAEIVGQACTILNCNTCQIARDGGDCHWCVLFRQGQLRKRECVLQRKDGDYVHIIKNAAVLKDGSGEVIGGVETMTDITELIEKNTQIEAYRRQLRAEDGFHGILGTSAVMQRVFDLIADAAQSDAPVLILGESGTGKELVARAIHDTGPRRQQPFVKVNCAALNENLLESELFGHVKGAYSGAYQSRKGRFEAADGGDIFLDEIGDLPLTTQVKLLRVLEEKVIERVGDHRPIQVDVRIITATNRDLKALVQSGAFRQDLFYRINVIPIQVPPLRDRLSDITLLAEHFFRRNRLKSDKSIKGISKEAMNQLLVYSWPGNVRELRSVFEFAFVASRGDTIQADDLPPDLQQRARGVVESEKPRQTKDEMKKQQLLQALTQCGGNQTRAAEMLGISRVTVWNRMKKYGIDLGANFSEQTPGS